MESSIDAALKSAVQALSDQNPEAAITTLEGLLSGETPLEPMSEMFAHGILATALAAVGKVGVARASAEKAHGIARGLGDEDSAAHYEGLIQQLDVINMSDDAIEQAFDRAGLALDRGDPTAAEAELQSVLIAALAHLRVDLEASARGMFAQALLMRGAVTDAIPHLERARDIATELADEGAAEHFGRILASLGSSEGADRYRVEAAIAKRADEVQQQAGKAMEEGDFDLAVSLIAPVADEAREAGAKESEGSLRGMLAQAYLLAGKRKEAEPEARRALELAESLGATEAAEGFRQVLQLAVGWTTPIAEA
jgi:tetratricopeptide (TPR) repeat protein